MLRTFITSLIGMVLMSDFSSKYIYKNFSFYLRNYRALLCLTQEDIAGELDVSQATVSGWEKGLYMPDLKQFLKFLDYVQCYDLERLFNFNL